MKKYISALLLATMLFAAGCSKYDDTRIRQDLDDVESILGELENTMKTLQEQMTAVTGLMGSRYVTLISTDAEGRYVITYMAPDGKTQTVTLVTDSEVVTAPVIGIAEDGGEWYWRQTADNGKTWEWIYADEAGTERFKVGGETPEVGIDAEGFWTVNGKPLTGKDGNKVLADDVSNILFRSVEVDEETGEAVFTLADGSEFRLQFFEALTLAFDRPVYSAVPDASTRLRIKYEVGGSMADDAIVDIFTAYNVEASIDTAISTITVSMPDGKEGDEGNILVMAHSTAGTILKPLFFTYGDAVIADPTYKGSAGDINIEGDLTQFEVSVSASIDYEVTVEESAQKWLLYNGTRAMTTKTYAFTADAYEDASGAIRSGVIRFANALYDISASITVRQSPNIPEGTGGGIGSAGDLLAFAAAVNAGGSTARWENEEGVVVLLDDIDMGAVESWTPIGSIDGSTYDTTTPYTVKSAFKGKFDGQGFAIKNLHYSTEVGTGDNYGYGLFAALDGATVSNLVLGDAETDITWVFTGSARKATTVAAFAAYAVNSTVENVVNYYNISFEGDSPSGAISMYGGIAGVIKNTTLGGRSKSRGCVNYGNVDTGIISNTENGGKGVQTAGICAFMAKDADNLVQNSDNYGHVSCPTGRTGGIVGTLMLGSIKSCDNYGFIEDDVFDQPTLNYNNKRMGGIVGGTDDLCSVPGHSIESCVNYGNVFAHHGCRTGGFAGHANIPIIGCENRGIILSEESTDHGAGWACGYSGNSTDTFTNIKGCTMGGKVGDYPTYKDNPEGAPAATKDNALAYKNSEYFDPSINQ